MKINKRLLVLIIILIFLLSIFPYLFIKGMEQRNNQLYNLDNYYEENQLGFNMIKNTIISNNLNGHIYTDTNIYKNYSSGDKNNCFNSNKCNSLNDKEITFLKNAGINYLNSSNQSISFSTNEGFLGSTKNFLLYSQGLFTSGKKFINDDENTTLIVKKKYSDDWGIVEICSSCGSGAWD